MKDEFYIDDPLTEDGAEEYFKKSDLDDLDSIKESIQSTLDKALVENEKLLKKVVAIYESQLKV